MRKLCSIILYLFLMLSFLVTRLSSSSSSTSSPSHFLYFNQSISIDRIALHCSSGTLPVVVKSWNFTLHLYYQTTQLDNVLSLMLLPILKCNWLESKFYIGNTNSSCWHSIQCVLWKRYSETEGSGSTVVKPRLYHLSALRFEQTCVPFLHLAFFPVKWV